MIVVVTNTFGSRGRSLLMPWFIAGALHLVLFAYAAPKLTTADFMRNETRFRMVEKVDPVRFAELAKKAAAEFGTTPPRPELTDEPVEVVEWRDGTILDTIYKPVPK